MILSNFEQGPIRPPSESKSLLIRVTRGCHWNKCHFCGLYKKHKFSIRSIEEIENDIIQAAEYYGGYPFTSCFLQDGDAFVFPTDKLIRILQLIKDKFPSLKSITSYARANSITRKSINELKEIKDAGLNHLYSGMETGSDIILKNINKGFTSRHIIDAGLAVKEAKITLSEFILLGIGGKEYWKENAEKTAKVLNIIKPEFIRAHATAIKQETELAQAMKRGEFKLQSEEEIVIEQRLLIEKLENIDSYYMNEHIVNLLMEVRGSLSIDKQKMLDNIDDYLKLSTEDKLNFALGRRLGYYFYLKDMENDNIKSIVNQNIKECILECNFDEVCNYYRQKMI